MEPSYSSCQLVESPLLDYTNGHPPSYKEDKTTQKKLYKLSQPTLARCGIYKGFASMYRTDLQGHIAQLEMSPQRLKDILTVDERNPEPVDMANIPRLAKFSDVLSTLW